MGLDPVQEECHISNAVCSSLSESREVSTSITSIPSLRSIMFILVASEGITTFLGSMMILLTGITSVVRLSVFRST